MEDDSHEIRAPRRFIRPSLLIPFGEASAAAPNELGCTDTSEKARAARRKRKRKTNARIREAALRRGRLRARGARGGEKPPKEKREEAAICMRLLLQLLQPRATALTHSCLFVCSCSSSSSSRPQQHPLKGILLKHSLARDRHRKKQT